SASGSLVSWLEILVRLAFLNGEGRDHFAYPWQAGGTATQHRRAHLQNAAARQEAGSVVENRVGNSDSIAAQRPFEAAGFDMISGFDLPNNFGHRGLTATFARLIDLSDARLK